MRLFILLIALMLTGYGASPTPVSTASIYKFVPEYLRETVTLSVITDKGRDKAAFKAHIRKLCSNPTADACTVWVDAKRSHALIYIAEPNNPMTTSQATLMGHVAWHAVRGRFHPIALMLDGYSASPTPVLTTPIYKFVPEYLRETVTLSVITDKGRDKVAFKALIHKLCSNPTADACTVWVDAKRNHALIYIAEPNNPMTTSQSTLMGHETWHAVRGRFHPYQAKWYR